MAQLNFIGQDERETETGPPVAMANQTLLCRFLADRAARGKCVKIAGEPERMEIVGVVEDVTSRSFRREVQPAMFMVSA